MILWLGCLGLAVHCGVGPLHAGTFIWNGSGNGTWSDGNDWMGGTAPTGVITDELAFGSAAAAGNRTAANDLSNAQLDSINFSASNYTLSQNAITLGSQSVAGSGFITVNAGAANNLISFNVQLGAGAGSQQFFTVNSGADLTMSGQISGSTGAQLIKQGTGTLTLSGDNSGYTGPVAASGGVLKIENANALGDTSNGTIVNTGSQLQVVNVSGAINENLTLNGFGPASDGALLNANGNNTWAGNVVLGSDSSIGASVGTTLNVSGQISDTGSGHNLTKVGAGQVVFSSAAGNTYRGTTTINNGTLSVNNASGSGTGSGAVHVNAGTLGGTGTIAGAVTIGTGSGPGAILSPGQSPGTLTIQSTLTLNSDATYKFELNSSTVTADEVIANGVTIGAGAQFTFTDLGNGELPLGTSFTVLDDTAGAPITGTFSNLVDGSMFTANGNTFLVNYEGGDGNDLTIEAVPEPSTWAAGLLMAGTLLCSIWRRRVKPC